MNTPHPILQVVSDYEHVPTDDQEYLVSVGTAHLSIKNITKFEINKISDVNVIELRYALISKKEMMDDLIFFKDTFHHIFTIETPTSKKHGNISTLNYNPPSENTHSWELCIIFIEI